MHYRSTLLACHTTTSKKAAILLYRPLALAVMHCALMTAANAQEGEAKFSSSGKTLLDEIVVTGSAVHDTETDASVSLTVIGAEEIEKSGLVSSEDVLRSTPGVSVNTSGGANVSSIYIRGIGALYPMSMDDAFVSVSLDGGPLTSRHLSFGNLDVKRIEILKGPQGTLSGGLGAAGAVNIITGRPTRDFEGYVRGEVGEEGQRLMSAAVGGPLTSELSGRLAVQQSNYDYPITNLQTGEPLSEPDLLGLRGSLNWDVTSQTSVLLSAEHHQSRHMGENIVLRPYDDEPLIDVTPGIYDYSEKTLDRYSLRINHQSENSNLTSTTTYSESENISPVFFDGLITEALFGASSEYWRDQESTEKTFTQDLRLTSLPHSQISWTLGLSALYSDRTYDHPRVGGAGFTVYPGTAQFRDFNTQRYGIYGDVTVPVAEQWNATGGLRYTWDRKTYDATYISRGVITSESDELSDDFPTGRLGLTYEVTPQTNIFATVSHGYNPGGFQDYAEYVGDARYKAGTVHSGELGFKSELMDQRLRINASVYLIDVKDNYLIDSDGVSSLVVNADTRSAGSDLEVSAWLSESLALSGLVSYINATIEDDVNTGFGPVRSGNSVPDVPEWSAKLSAVYHMGLPGNAFLTAPSLNARIDYRYVGSRPADVQNNFDLEDYHDIGVSLAISNNNAEFYVWGRNLLDEHYDLYGFYGGSGGVTYGTPSRGRTLGLGFKYQF